MRILHSADWHIGQGRRFGSNYLDRHREVLTDVFETAIKHKVDYMLAVGDIFHRQDTTHDERELLYELLAKYDGRVQLYISDGNHDEVNSTSSQLTPLKLIADKFETIKIIARKPELFYIRQDIHNHVMHEDLLLCIPWGDYERDQLEQIVTFHYESRFSVDDPLHEKGKKVIRSFVVTVHEGFYGYETDIGYKESRSSKIKKSLPDLPFVTNWLAGDIHKFQTISGLPNAFYSGAPAQWDFGDKLPKGILIIDTDKPKEPEFIEIKSLPLVTAVGIDQIPEYDAIVKLIAPADQIPAVLPDKVKIVEPYQTGESTPDFKPEAAIASTFDDLTEGLAELMELEGLSAEQQVIAFNEVALAIKQLT